MNFLLTLFTLVKVVPFLTCRYTKGVSWLSGDGSQRGYKPAAKKHLVICPEKLAINFLTGRKQNSWKQERSIERKLGKLLSLTRCLHSWPKGKGLDLRKSFPASNLIKTVTKFSNMIGYHQPNLSTNKTMYMSCL